jgi:hypothetical protein
VPAAATPFTFSGSLDYPPDVGQPVAKRAFSGSDNFRSKGELNLDLVGAGTHTVGMGTIPAAGVKGILVEVDITQSAAAIQLRINGGTEDWEVSPGGFMAYFSPTPVAGITAIDIVHTTDVCVRVRFVG